MTPGTPPSCPACGYGSSQGNVKVSSTPLAVQVQAVAKAEKHTGQGGIIDSLSSGVFDKNSIALTRERLVVHYSNWLTGSSGTYHADLAKVPGIMHGKVWDMGMVILGILTLPILVGAFVLLFFARRRAVVIDSPLGGLKVVFKKRISSARMDEFIDNVFAAKRALA